MNVTGRIEVYKNGELLLTKAGAVASGIGLSGQPNFELRAIVGDSGLHGYTEEPIMARCQVTITDRDDIKLNDIAAVNGDGTIIFRRAGGKGKIYTMEGATCLRNFSLTGGEGEVPVIFEGPYWIEGIQ